MPITAERIDVAKAARISIMVSIITNWILHYVCKK